MTPPTFPARPVNGGPLERAMSKRGEWLVEPKYNGWRTLVHVPTGTMFNRHGARLTIAAEFAKALEQLRDGLQKKLAKLLFTEKHGLESLTAAQIEWADCEGLERRHQRGRGSLIVLDLPMLHITLEKRGFVLRETFCPAIDHCATNSAVYSVPQWTDPTAVWSELKSHNRDLGCDFYEGVVMKRTDSFYPLQRRSPQFETPAWMKHRWHF